VRRFALERIALTIPVLLGVSIVVFALLRLTPGDPISVLLGLSDYDPALADALRRQYGLDRSIPEQYVAWLSRAVTGDIGRSIRTHQPVTELIAQALGPTVMLAGAALVLAVVIGLVTGLVAALRRGSALDAVLSTLTVGGLAIPNFWLAVLMIYIVALQLRWLPPAGYISPTDDLIGALKSVALPAIALALRSAAVIARMLRSSLLEVLSDDYIRTARAKGLRESLVVGRHALRNALVPVITVIGIQAGTLVGGTIIVETIFAWPGIGKLVSDAIFSRDFPVVQGAVLVTSAAVVGINVAVDLLYGYVDPRIKYG
jgi:peptide/nickel transport system permease protein